MFDNCMDKEKVKELLESLGHRVIDVPDIDSSYGSLIIISDEKSEVVLRYEATYHFQ
jgi:hypothetical protein